MQYRWVDVGELNQRAFWVSRRCCDGWRRVRLSTWLCCSIATQRNRICRVSVLVFTEIFFILRHCTRVSPGCVPSVGLPVGDRMVPLGRSLIMCDRVGIMVSAILDPVGISVR